MNKNLKRESFLKHEWAKYPSVAGLKKAGRIMLIQKSGIVLVGGARIRFKTLNEFMMWKEILIPGDIIAVEKDGSCRLLAPWAGSNDKAFDRKLADDIKKKVEQQKKWNHFIKLVNQFFHSQDFLAVQTPTLVNSPGPEPTIDVFKTGYKVGRQATEKYLITSPELHLKKILSQAVCPVYEIAKVFRNNEHSPKHRPEFWMLEWYRPFADLVQIKKDVKELISFLLKSLKIRNQKLIFEETSFQKVLKEKFGFDLRPDTSAEELKKWLQRKAVHFSEPISLDDLFTLINIEWVEPQLNPQKIVFLEKYPPYAAALAKIDENGWAQRFEVYWKGLELGNAFNELNDPHVQEQRLNEDNRKKLSNGLEILPLDFEFLESLKEGMPPAAGIAIGLERLFMALYDEAEIKNLTWF